MIYSSLRTFETKKKWRTHDLIARPSRCNADTLPLDHLDAAKCKFGFSAPNLIEKQHTFPFARHPPTHLKHNRYKQVERCFCCDWWICRWFIQFCDFLQEVECLNYLENLYSTCDVHTHTKRKKNDTVKDFLIGNWWAAWAIKELGPERGESKECGWVAVN